MLRDAQRRREGKVLFGPAFSLGPKRAQECSRGGESYRGSIARPNLSYLKPSERCAATPLLVLQPELFSTTCWPLPRIW